MFENRTYRMLHHKKGLVSFNITVKETNLNIQAEKDLTDMAIASVIACRHHLETVINRFPEFAASLSPIKKPEPAMPKIISDMIAAAQLARVGPMAAVAGAVAEYTGTALMGCSGQVVVENGGDIFIKSESETIFSIYAGNSPFSMTTGIRVKKNDRPYGICTSSGTFGHSKSFGSADAATVLSDSCVLADAVATKLCNMVQHPADIENAIQAGKAVSGIRGIVIIKGDNIGLWGDLKLVSFS
ncbi:MAG: UPF0280 family protein [Desulfotignum sp.]|nr:UPF0280 family protein [Desulfotignum sp.]